MTLHVNHQTIHMKCLIFSPKNKKKKMRMLYAENLLGALRVKVSDRGLHCLLH